jgi:hypothetical protein
VKDPPWARLSIRVPVATQDQDGAQYTEVLAHYVSITGTWEVGVVAQAKHSAKQALTVAIPHFRQPWGFLSL